MCSCTSRVLTIMLFTFPLIGTAHPGHGLVESTQGAHYFTSEHVLPIALLLLVGFAIRSLVNNKLGASQTLNI